MKYFIIFSLAIYSNPSLTQTVWPNTTTPCNTTLEACIDGSPLGETIEIHTDGPIDESIFTNNSVSLVAGTGYRPVFALDRDIQINGFANEDLTITVAGLTFLKGGISFNNFSDSDVQITLNYHNNRIIENLMTSYAMRVLNFGDSTVEVNIHANQINYMTTSSSTDRTGAVAITNGTIGEGSSSGQLTGRIYNNLITATGSQARGIGLYEFSNNSSDLNISSNEIRGSQSAAVYYNKTPGSLGTSQIDFAHNALYSNQVESFFRGFTAIIADGEAQLNIINNSMVGAFEGYNFQKQFGGVTDVNFYNNLITDTNRPILINNPTVADSLITFDNDHNLLYNNTATDPDFTPGPAHLSVNPRIKGRFDARLRPGSPAIEMGNTLFLLLIGDVPIIDADGLFRIKNGNPNSGGLNIDIGAYEAGDVRTLDRLKGSATNINLLESAAINNEEFAKIQITQNFNPDGTNPFDGIRNDLNLGVFRVADAWAIFTQDFSLIETDTAFNVWNPAPSGQNFVHTASDAISATESFTELDRTGLNNNPNAILSVTQFWEGLYNDNPVGVFYNPFTSRWNIYNSNFEDMPWMAQFNVYYQESSSNAFIHQTSEANIVSDATFIDHPLLNNSPCAQFQVTYDSGIVFPHKTGVFYEQNRAQWGVFIQSGEVMPESAKFHVIVSAEQIAACNDIIFADKFE